jgi:hypothetical protein
MSGNLVVDLDSYLSPDDPNFPMTMSREQLTTSTHLAVDKWVTEMTRNSKTTDEVVRRSLETPDVKFVRGKIMYGKREDDHLSDDLIQSISHEKTVQVIQEWLTAVQNTINLDDSKVSQYIDMGSNHPLLRLRNYEPEPEDVERDAALVNTWALILELVLPSGTPFGIGLISAPNTISEIETVDGIVFFSLNPSKIVDSLIPEGTILSMWAKACHESAHVSVRDHDEQFASLMDTIMSLTSSQIFWKMGQLVKSLEER